MDNNELLSIYKAINFEGIEVGLNPFVMMADQGDVRAERFHSRVIGSILDPEKINPDTGKPQGIKMLEAFVAYLTQVANSRNAQAEKLLQDVVVTTDTKIKCEQSIGEQSNEIDDKKNAGFIDILIWDENKRWSIIIENKINGAPDMKRQLPRYYDYAVGMGYPPKAIVYLHAYNEKAQPEDKTWTGANDKTNIASCLLPIAGYCTPTANSLGGWIGNEATDRKSSEPRFAEVLRLYGELLKKQAEETLCDDGLKRLADACSAERRGLAELPGLCSDERLMLRLRGMLVRYIERECDKGAFAKLFAYGGDRTAFFNFPLKVGDVSIGLKLDVRFSKRGSAIMFPPELRLFTENDVCTKGVTKQNRADACKCLVKVIEGLSTEKVKLCKNGETDFWFTVKALSLEELRDEMNKFVGELSNKKQDMIEAVCNLSCYKK